MIGRPSGTSAAGTVSIVPERGETPEYPEWVWQVMAQRAGNEMVTRVENANDRVVLAAGADAGCRAEAVELIERLNTQVHSGFRLSVGGTTALTPTLSRSGENSPKPIFVLLAPESKSAQPIDNQCRRFCLHGEGELSAASVRCGSLGLSCGRHADRGLGSAATRTLEAKSDGRGQVEWAATQSRGIRQWR